MPGVTNKERYELLYEMYTGNKDKNKSKGRALQTELPVSEVFTLQDNLPTGVDCSVIIGDEGQPAHVLCNPNVRRGTFTAIGLFKKGRLQKFLEKAAEKYRVEVKIFLYRRVRKEERKTPLPFADLYAILNPDHYRVGSRLKKDL